MRQHGEAPKRLSAEQEEVILPVGGSFAQTQQQNQPHLSLDLSLDFPQT